MNTFDKISIWMAAIIIGMVIFVACDVVTNGDTSPLESLEDSTPEAILIGQTPNAWIFKLVDEGESGQPLYIYEQKDSKKGHIRSGSIAVH